jgi:ribonuclease PH
VTQLDRMGERQIKIDCDVIQADGGTRTAAITGGFVALALAFQKLVEAKTLDRIPLSDHVAAISCGLVKGTVVLDLDYIEDSGAEADANFVLTAGGLIVEVQGTAETAPFPRAVLSTMLSMAEGAVAKLVVLQRAALGGLDIAT